MDDDKQDAGAVSEDRPLQLAAAQDENATASAVDPHPSTRPKSPQEQIAEEQQPIAIESKLSEEEVVGPQDEESGEVARGDVTADQEQKNWGEFGYDLDFAETPNDIASTNQEPVDATLGPVMSEEQVDCDKTEIALEIAQDLNQMLESKGSSGASTTTTTTTITSSRTENITIPSGEAVEKADKGDGAAPGDERPQLQNTFDAFLSDDDDDTLIANIWDGTNREPTEKKPMKPIQYPTQQGNRVPSSSGDSSEHDIVEHGSTLFGWPTRNVIWTAAVIFCSAILVVCLSLIIALVTTDDGTSETNPRPPSSETINPGDFVAPTNGPGTEFTTETTPVAPVSTEGTPILQDPEPTPTTSPTSSSVCDDFDGNRFFVNGMSRNCAWLRGNTTDDFQRSICEWNEPIRSNCRATCGTCDDGTPSVPAPSPVTAPTLTTSPTLLSAAASCPPDLLGNIPGETVTCLWLSRVNEHYRVLQCTEELTREHCPATCRIDCGTLE